MRDITTIDQMWLAELAPHYYNFKNPNIKAAKAGDPDAEMFEEGTHKRRKLGPVRRVCAARLCGASVRRVCAAPAELLNGPWWWCW